MWTKITSIFRIVLEALGAYFVYTRGKQDQVNEDTSKKLGELVKQVELSAKVDSMSDTEVFDLLKTKPKRKHTRE